ncbi:uncharacterized protein F5147DRAFT_272629 [Suillus discolor]|uniref:Uncharacterized protein n=1 Tax=Suillus discolor TaxID=1912936 RepID=A0A9P7JS52_9AGAM|nr:uncharacterized protein F5147DRAFT_272629 [Suillus discolor]KAG2104095.1 hypothetical protein F5147DRAFT_272629 [Suillus discolor]
MPVTALRSLLLFFDGIIKETLRLHPSCPVMDRVASNANTLPLQFPTRSRSSICTSAAATLEGAYSIIPILAANRHREIAVVHYSVMIPATMWQCLIQQGYTISSRVYDRMYDRKKLLQQKAFARHQAGGILVFH